jgi:hypothetical protein
MKMVFLVHSEWQTPRVMELLAACGIDYYTRWDKAQGKGRGTEPHLGTGSFGSTNSVFMIAFEQEAPLEHLIRTIAAANAEILRPADRIRLFQMPLERIV